MKLSLNDQENDENMIEPNPKSQPADREANDGSINLN